MLLCRNTKLIKDIKLFIRFSYIADLIFANNIFLLIEKILIKGFTLKTLL
ncbi:predicted protein [Plenodomus lingam JN3]|uniref:Predicted protein n=1 Tax=Leptosphaeria maculans (strain JN3 / isolate v23.1.3 / race Av1-4-5-6-7-8) TaxID=985895 RepID=E5AEP7_LEPMJ|nr:predicted protein [Plenodomus lingam JN3]CBY01686.1 predicted protein [Plenodomus lingam JN3]